VWQFPHFWAIAWKYRQEYREAGFYMVPFHDDQGFVVGKMMWLLSLALLAVSLIPFLTGWRSGFYAAGALLLGLWLAHSFRAIFHAPAGWQAGDESGVHFAGVSAPVVVVADTGVLRRDEG
jgi:heme O synthase-like polyprenyltransferase